jgi:glycosyltransferase involved in cell wall biosynthesis
MSQPGYDLTLVLACYNEAQIFENNIKQIFEVLDNTTLQYEVIFVDDGSKDNTRDLIDQLLQTDQEHCLSKLFHEQNVGRGGTVADGMRRAKGEIVGFIDIDLETHARYIPSCVLAIKKGADIAMAERIYKFSWRSLDRYLLSRGYAWLVHSLFDLPVKDTETGFKFFKRLQILPVLEEIKDKGWFWDTEIIVRSHLKGYRIDELPCLFVRRFDKRSTVKVIPDVWDYFVKLWAFRAEVKSLNKGNLYSPPKFLNKPEA